MLYKNLTVRELLATLPMTEDIVEFFDKGLRRGNDRLAGSAMEELIRRGETGLIVETLDKFYKGSYTNKSDSTLFVLMADLAESCREEDALLGNYASHGIQDCGPTEWIRQNAERFKKFYRSGAVVNAKPWAKKYLT
ncbi:MAG: hypothetical protein Q4A36_03220 [Candidatus Saccharibacteria bacterium]|nr:hypothetical protein [Candidatus Saccharibacteria bacterium]